MKLWKKWAAAWGIGLTAALLAVAADEKAQRAPAERGGLVVVDARGKEHRLKAWQFLAGTRRLNWLAPGKEEPGRPEGGGEKSSGKGRPPAPRPQGPEALVFRDENSTVWAQGVQTLIPLDRIRNIEYDAEKQAVTVRIAASDRPEDDLVLTGSTRFRGSNRLAIEAEVDKGELGIAAVKYLGGTPGGVRALRFPAPKAAPALTGRPAQVTVLLDDDKKGTEKVADLQALYRTAGGEKLSPMLLFKKTVKLDLTRLKKMTAADPKGVEWQLSLKNGDDETLTLLRSGELAGRPVQLVGFLGRVPAGYKLFPVHTVTEIQFDEARGAEKKP